MRTPVSLVVLLVLSLFLSFTPTQSATPPKAGAACQKLGVTKIHLGKKFTCVKKGKKLVWNKGTAVSPPTSNNPPSPATAPSTKPAPSASLTPTPSPSPTSSPIQQVQLPTEGSICNKIGEKIITSYGYLRCTWPGGPISTGDWRAITVKKLSTSASNNYKTVPVAMESCENSGDTFDVPGGYLECRWTHGKKLKWIRLSSKNPGFRNTISPKGIELCKLQNADALERTGRDSGVKVAFPMDATRKNGMNPKGTNKVLIVGVDFPQLRGNYDLLETNRNDIKIMLDWYRYFSNNQVSFEVSTIDYWINSPRSLASYEKYGDDGNSSTNNRFNAERSQPFVDLITQHIDLRTFSTVYMIFPDGATDWKVASYVVRNELFKIKEGQTRLNFFGWSHDNEMAESLRWAFYIHETLHDFDIVGHAPGNGWPFSIMQNNVGVSMAMNPYEQFLLDWLPENQIYCDDAETLTKVTISLSPIEREDKKTKMAIIRLSHTQLIVIESHSIDKWSDFKKGDRTFPPGFYGVMAYIIDLNKAVNTPVLADSRSSSNKDFAWAVYQEVQGGKSTDFPVTFPAAFGEDVYLALAVLGDSFLIDGLRIKLVGTGDFETIEISRESSPSPKPAPSPRPTSNPDDFTLKICYVLNEIVKNSVGEFHCQNQNGEMRWAKNNPDPNASSRP